MATEPLVYPNFIGRRPTSTDLRSRRPLTLREIAKRLDVTGMTLHNWRQGSQTREPLPAKRLTGGKPRVIVEEGVLLGWLNQHRKDLARQWIKQR